MKLKLETLGQSQSQKSGLRSLGNWALNLMNMCGRVDTGVEVL